MTSVELLRKEEDELKKAVTAAKTKPEAAKDAELRETRKKLKRTQRKRRSMEKMAIHLATKAAPKVKKAAE